MTLIVQLLLLICFVFPAVAQESDWEEKWNDVLAAARKEGKVVVKGSPIPEVRQMLPEKFTARYGIPVEFIAGRSSEIAARVLRERRAGHYTLDVLMGGIDTVANVLYAEKMLDPLKPALILPEVVDPSKWKKGKLSFLDPEGVYVLRLLAFRNALFQINTSRVKPNEFKSIKDLLNPKWKGKIALLDPTVAGNGLGYAAHMYVEFGEEFVKRLYIDQQPVFSRSSRQVADWLARGTYPITLGARQVPEMQEEGFPVMSIYELPDYGGKLVSGTGHVVLLNKSPRPNAARVFANWIASREGLGVYSKAQRQPTMRNDIDESFVPPEEIPRPDVKYFDNGSWAFAVSLKQKVKLRMKELLKK